MILVPTSICARASGPSGSSADQTQPPAPIGDKSFRPRRGLIPYPGRPRLFSRVLARGGGVKGPCGPPKPSRGIPPPPPPSPQPATFPPTGPSPPTPPTPPPPAPATIPPPC